MTDGGAGNGIDHRKHPKLLDVLPAAGAARLEEAGERLRLKRATVLYDVNEPQRHAYFPDGAVISLLARVGDGEMVEAGLAGWEGFVGLPILLGTSSTPNRGQCQVEGMALRVPAAGLLRAVEEQPQLRDTLLKYAHLHFAQAAQTAACQGAHSVIQRCARWLLMVHDRVEGDEFTLTQEFLSQMLGARRASVSEAMSALRKRGLATYHRGRVHLLDRAGMIEASCVCYGLVRREFARVLGG